MEITNKPNKTKLGFKSTYSHPFHHTYMHLLKSTRTQIYIPYKKIHNQIYITTLQQNKVKTTFFQFHEFQFHYNSRQIKRTKWTKNGITREIVQRNRTEQTISGKEAKVEWFQRANEGTSETSFFIMSNIIYADVNQKWQQPKQQQQQL